MKQLRLLTCGSLFLAGCAAYLYASRIEVKRYRLEHVRVTTLNGTVPQNVFGQVQDRTLKILHLSDTHLYHPEKEKLDFLRSVTNDDYDIVILTGDIFEDLSGLPYVSSLLSRKPRLGAYAVLGNHDYYDYTLLNKTIGLVMRKYRQPSQKRDVRPIVEALEAVGFTVMRNQAHTLKEEKLHIIGIDYPGIDDSALMELLSDVPTDYLTLALMHVPKLESMGRVGMNLVFAGHTHGGQVRLPIIGALTSNSELPPKEASGLLWRGRTACHVSRGIGADPRVNLRLLCPPAATVLEVTHNFKI